LHYEDDICVRVANDGVSSAGVVLRTQDVGEGVVYGRGTGSITQGDPSCSPVIRASRNTSSAMRKESMYWGDEINVRRPVGSSR
jgi:hypothetical protein